MVAALLVGFAVLGLVASQGASATGDTASSYASTLLSLLNQARADGGLPSLVDTLELNTVAVTWSDQLGRRQALSHNPDLRAQLESHGSGDWTTYGENVGDAPTDSPSYAFTAYMHSPEHRANILDPSYRFVGVGVVFTSGTAWDTLDFVDNYSTTPAPAGASSGTTRERPSPEVPEPVATGRPPAPTVQFSPPVRLRRTRAAPSAIPVPRKVPTSTVAAPQVKQPFTTTSEGGSREGRNPGIYVAVALTLALLAGHWLVQRPT